MIAEASDATTAQDEQWWAAVLARDESYDGTFLYAVRSTGVYCKPSCPSRRPQRAQAVFFTDASAAQQAGFRPCKRCRPGSSNVPESQVEMVNEVCRYIEANLDGQSPITLQALGEQVNFSPYHLQRVFKRVTGVTPRQYVQALRLARLKQGLKEGEQVTQALYDAGFSSSSRLYEKAPAQLGMTPDAYRRGGEGVTIHYTVVDSPFGLILIAATEKGISAITMGDSEEELEASLSKEYPAARIRQDASNPVLARWVNAVMSYIEDGQIPVELPLDVQATAFQRRVWETLRQIPFGSTRSYAQVAQAVGRPSAARAVARACASNHAALLIPCHRVVREDGSLGGYRWGVERKRLILSHEQR